MNNQDYQKKYQAYKAKLKDRIADEQLLMMVAHQFIIVDELQADIDERGIIVQSKRSDLRKPNPSVAAIRATIGTILKIYRYAGLLEPSPEDLSINLD